MLSLRGIDAFYGETQALFGASLEVGAGEVVALLGPNGAGKTTTLRSILALTDVPCGKIVFDGEEITALPTHEIARRGIGWVPDDRRIFPTLTVQRNLSIAKKRSRFRAWSEQDCFAIFSALEYLLHRECENLSGGEMQMVAISRALLGSPGLVLFDEPSQGRRAAGAAGHPAAEGRGHRRAGGRAEPARRARRRRPRLRHGQGPHRA
jgi:branched-chain amino acid transport system ATP-binding protein